MFTVVYGKFFMKLYMFTETLDQIDECKQNIFLYNESVNMKMIT